MSDDRSFIKEIFGDDWFVIIGLGSLFGSLTVVLYWYLNTKFVLIGFPGQTLYYLNNTMAILLVFLLILISFFITRMKELADHPFIALGVFFLFIITSASVTGLILNFGWLWARVIYSILIAAMFLAFAFAYRVVILSGYGQ
jgi:hypothetical protein